MGLIRISWVLTLALSTTVVSAMPPSLPSSQMAYQAQNYENAAPAWYQMPERQQENTFTNNRSPYGPQPDKHTFIPVPSPFELPRPKTPLEMANGHIVDAAQETHLSGFFRTLNGQVTNLERYMPLLAKKLGITSLPILPTTTDRPSRPSQKPTQSLRSYHTRPSPPERPFTVRGTKICWDCTTVTMQLVTPTPMNKRKTKIVKKNKIRSNQVTRRTGDYSTEDYGTTRTTKDVWASMQVTTKDHWKQFTVGTRATTERSDTPDRMRKNARGLVKIENGGEIKEKRPKITQNGRISKPYRPDQNNNNIDSTNSQLGSSTSQFGTHVTPVEPQNGRQISKTGQISSKKDRFVPQNGRNSRPNSTKSTKIDKQVTEDMDNTPINTKVDINSNEYTKLSISGQSLGTGRPDMVLESIRSQKGPLNKNNMREIMSLGPMEMLNKAKNGWTHKENRPKIDCPESNVSPIEVAIVWASTELIEAIKEALAKFRSTLSARQMAPEEGHADIADLGRELESTWTQLKDSGFLERAVAELALSDSQVPGHDGTVDTDAAARKIDELWREAMLASAIGFSEPDPMNRPMYDDIRGHQRGNVVCLRRN
ncbi:unnamed protein product [Bursaphelenchus okinawaensis]|uniref:Uncharacterized protein n=1 Tax=Bursaphelenchus okinawaensis TaxID=465554 RepID=A0A811LF03_9BILA|nr:unnamed protein product [Bursaphelenchus okinawaensis]CAG9121817.1 unnamed protein product [Bursaphelenchus okinawaensis]